ncbi:extracellular solute-binding protein [Metabacillus sp. GX 13764]|uniref:sugar ABC transporter substrate-binding protein n=1 Tax=Metabacillus kandeliae TaxID=2900151 RepID=UPI001E2D8A57|nr:extracellular solute-binding protein [Metabacillus kandeliae]MCD7034922.1 extracellular solute-binding protein [Metabacillus kandeliae]
MKKVLSLFAMVLLLIGVLAACGPDAKKDASSEPKKDGTEASGGMPAKPEKLVVWEDQKKAGWLKQAAADFEKENGIKIEYKDIEMATKQREQLRLDGPTGKGPDVVTLPHDQIGQLAVEGLLAPIKVDQKVLDTFTESSIKSQTYEGQLYGLPKSTETPVLIYNKKLVQDVPATMEDLYAKSKELTKGDQYGFLALFDNFYFAHAVIGGMGGYVFGEKDGKMDPTDIGLNNEGAVKGAEFIQKWYKEGLFPKGIIGENGGSALDGLFTEGKVAYVMNGPWAFGPYKDAKVDIGVAPLPKFADGTPMKTFSGVKGWNISAFSKNKEWATKFVEYVTSEKVAKERYKQTFEIPPVKSLMEDPIIKDNPEAKAVAEQSAYSVPMPNIPEMGQVWQGMADNLQTLVTGKAEPKPALDAAVKRIKSDIEAAGSGAK